MANDTAERRNIATCRYTSSHIRMREMLRRVFLSLATVATWAVWTEAVSAPATEDSVPVTEGCSFLTNAEVEKITEDKLLFKLRSMPLPNGIGTVCDSDSVRLVVFSGENPEEHWEDMLKGFGREGEERIPISGLGDEAYGLYLEPRKESEHPTAVIAVTSGSQLAIVSVQAKDGEPAESMQPQATELAKIVLSRLKSQ